MTRRRLAGGTAALLLTVSMATGSAAAQSGADIPVQASLTLPEGFGFGSALETTAEAPAGGGGRVRFRPVCAGTLADSPLFAGRHFRRVDLDPEARAAGRATIALDVVTDTAVELAAIENGVAMGDFSDWAKRAPGREADMLIREASNGARSMDDPEQRRFVVDDFARDFFGVQPGIALPPEQPSTYTFADIVRTFNRVQPHEWAAFLRTWLDSHGPGAPLGGLARGGWKLAFSEQPSDDLKAQEARRRHADFSHSIGIVVGRMDRIESVEWGSPAFNAPLAPSCTLLAVNGVAYKADRLKEAITAAKSGAPLELLVKAGDRFNSVRIDYRGGLRYPKLERIEHTPDRSSELFAPK